MGRDSPKILYRPMNQARGMRAAACIFRARFTSSHNNSTAKRFCLTSIDPRTGAVGCPKDQGAERRSGDRVLWDVVTSIAIQAYIGL